MKDKMDIDPDTFVKMYVKYMESDHHKEYNSFKFNHLKRGYLIQDSMRDFFSGKPVPKIPFSSRFE